MVYDSVCFNGVNGLVVPSHLQHTAYTEWEILNCIHIVHNVWPKHLRHNFSMKNYFSLKLWYEVGNMHPFKEL